MTIKLTRNDAEEVAHKLGVLADTPDLCDDYGLTEQQAATLRDSVPHEGGTWTVPTWGEAAVRGEMADHCKVLADIASDARSGGEAGQALRIAKQAKRIGEAFVGSEGTQRMNKFTEAEQEANVRRVIGTEVTLRSYLGTERPKTARIRNYVPPCVWELDREIGSPKNSFHHDKDVCLLNGESVGSLIPDRQARTANASYEYHRVREDVVFILDLDGDVTVTNDAERVVVDVLAVHPGKRIVYRDTEGRWDELKHDGEKFTHFAPLSLDEQVKFASVVDERIDIDGGKPRTSGGRRR